MFRWYQHAIVLVIAIFIILAIIWAATTKIQVVTSGQGQVVPTRKIQMASALEGGRIQKIYVKEGDIVRKGQKLIKLVPTQWHSEYQKNQKKLNILTIKKHRLQAELNNKPLKIPEKLKKQYPQSARNQRLLYEARQVRRRLLKEIYKFARKELTMTKPLVKKGAASQVKLLRLQRTAANMKKKQVKFKNETIESLQQTRQEIAVLKETIRKNLFRLKQATMTAPVHGIIKKIHVNTIGGVADPGQDLVEIVPLEGQLTVETKIKPPDIGFIHPGQRASVKIQAYDYSIYGDLKGKVKRISADSIKDKKGNIYYLVYVETQTNHLGTKQDPKYIKPGMTATVDITTSKQTIMNYLLRPLYQIKSRAFQR